MDLAVKSTPFPEMLRNPPTHTKSSNYFIQHTDLPLLTLLVHLSLGSLVKTN